MKSGKGIRGIIGSGAILSTPYRAEHYNEADAESGKDALFVDVKFDYLVKPGSTPPVYRSELDGSSLSSTVWDAQGSGKTIPDETAHALYDLLKGRVELEEFHLPDELAESATLFEGAMRTISVNAYERNPEIRRKCLNKWGHNCSVCGFRFELFYGPIGKGYIHVHHLRPLSSLKSSHEVDPLEDLRPVCPNCHAMLHRSDPPMAIEELIRLVASYGGRR